MLPDKPSELIMLALQDLVEVMNDPNYIVDMDEWHKPVSKNVCLVCLAGAVMAKSLGCDINKYLEPYTLNDSYSDKLPALDAFREGSVDVGLAIMGLYSPNYADHRTITPFHEDKEQFFMDMTDLANDLATEGL